MTDSGTAMSVAYGCAILETKKTVPIVAQESIIDKQKGACIVPSLCIYCIKHAHSIYFIYCTRSLFAHIK